MWILVGFTEKFECISYITVLIFCRFLQVNEDYITGTPCLSQRNLQTNKPTSRLPLFQKKKKKHPQKTPSQPNQPHPHKQIPPPQNPNKKQAPPPTPKKNPNPKKPNKTQPKNSKRKKGNKISPFPEVRETMLYLSGFVLSKGCNDCISQKSCPSTTEIYFIIRK